MRRSGRLSSSGPAGIPAGRILAFVLVFAAGFLAHLWWRRPSEGKASPASSPAPRNAPRRLPGAGSESRAPFAAPRRRDPSREIVLAGDPAPHPRLAILIDDLGNDPRALSRLLAIGQPISGAVLPGLAHSAETAEALSRAGREVLLHLPLEPVSSRENPGPGLIRTSLNDRQVADVLGRDLADVPHASGVNNHMGSKGTADSRLMDAVMAALHERGLYFLDSRTTEWTRAEEAARRHGVPFLTRNVFLDDVSSEEAVAAQLQKAIETARAEGLAVAIGHPHAPTFAVLEREMPKLAAQGVTPVFVSNLLR